jgi:hypothetical protein
MSVVQRIHDHFAALLDEVLSRDHFTEADLRGLILATKDHVVQAVAEQGHVQALAARLHLAPVTWDGDGDLCVPPAKKIRAPM